MRIEFHIFRENLIILRRISGITSKQLSEDLGMRQQKRVSDIEEGRGLPTLEEINEVAVYFNVSIDDILKRRAHLKVEFTDTL